MDSTPGIGNTHSNAAAYGIHLENENDVTRIERNSIRMARLRADNTNGLNLRIYHNTIIGGLGTIDKSIPLSIVNSGGPGDVEIVNNILMTPPGYEYCMDVFDLDQSLPQKIQGNLALTGCTNIFGDGDPNFELKRLFYYPLRDILLSLTS